MRHKLCIYSGLYTAIDLEAYKQRFGVFLSTHSVVFCGGCRRDKGMVRCTGGGGMSCEEMWSEGPRAVAVTCVRAIDGCSYEVPSRRIRSFQEIEMRALMYRRQLLRDVENKFDTWNPRCL